MSSIAVTGSATGTGVISLLAPVTSTNRTLTLPDATGTVALQGGTGVGKVLQVVQLNLPATYSFTTTSMTAISGFSQAITPTSATSKILVSVSLGKVTNDSGGISTTAFAFARDGSLIGVGNAAGARIRSTFTVATNADNNHGSGAAFIYLDSPATTSSVTYSIYAQVSSNTTYINRTVSDYDNTTAYASRTNSTITLMEIAA